MDAHAAPSTSKIDGAVLEDGLKWLPVLKIMFRRTMPLVLSLASLAACTWFAFHLRLNLASSGFICLTIVVLAAVYGGFWQATITSIVAVACLDYFFVQPLFSFAAADPRNWLALTTFEVTSLVVARLSHRAQIKTSETITERLDTERLYKTSQQILLLERLRDPIVWVPRIIGEVFGLKRVVLFDAATARTCESTERAPESEERTRAAYFTNSDNFDPEEEAWFCALRFGTRPVGGLGLYGAKLSALVATSLASLSAIALERSRSLERELHAEAARETEQLRTAVLDALAHEFKTPLSTIRTASSGLLATRALSDSQAELVGLIDEEANELNNLASRLLRIARLDTVEFKPSREPLLLSSLVEPAMEDLKQPFALSRIRATVSQGEIHVLADRKLITTVLTQLLENALKYSLPESPVQISITKGESEGILSVQSEGQTISPSDRERIFDRFYRCSGSEQGPPGTGLGLSIVKRIVDAHYGRVWVECDSGHHTTFFFAVPEVSEK